MGQKMQKRGGGGGGGKKARHQVERRNRESGMQYIASMGMYLYGP
jgi:hypothetical protein